MVINYPAIREAESFHGFRTVHFYEIECAKAGLILRRIPVFTSDGTEAICLLTVCPTGGPGSYDRLDIITPDESHCLYSGSARHDGSDLASVLSRAGFRLEQERPAVISIPEPADGEDLQLSLFA